MAIVGRIPMDILPSINIRLADSSFRIIARVEGKWLVIKDRYAKNTPYEATEEILLPHLPEIILGHTTLYELDNKTKERFEND